MAGLVPAIDALLADRKDVDARHKAGHDEKTCYDCAKLRNRARRRHFVSKCRGTTKLTVAL
jgi:hypothetical protein